MGNKQLLERVVNQAVSGVASKWVWQMDYCKQMGWSPANDYFWNRSEEAYKEHIKAAAQSQERP